MSERVSEREREGNGAKEAGRGGSVEVGGCAVCRPACARFCVRAGVLACFVLAMISTFFKGGV